MMPPVIAFRNVLVLLGDHPGNFRLLLGVALMSATAAFFFPLQGAMISRYFGEKHFGRVIGLLNFFFVFGALGPPIAGLMRDRLGSYHLLRAGDDCHAFVDRAVHFFAEAECRW